MSSLLDKITEACIKANSEILIDVPRCVETGTGATVVTEKIPREVQLADVLLAINGERIYSIDSNGDLYFQCPQGVKWNLTKGLYGQSLETLQFIYSLLFTK